MVLAVLVTALGGAVNGSFAVPMKRIRGWEWEHSWFVWAVSGLLLVPGINALLTVPGLFDVYKQTSWSSLTQVMVMGFLWGISAVLFGLGIDRMGLAIGYGIILGMSSALGAIGPLITKHSDQLFAPTGIQTMAGVALVVGGVAACAVAGRIRENAAGSSRQDQVAGGLAICIASGVLAPMMNFGLAYGIEIADNARLAGAGEGDLVNAIWPVLLVGGFAANALYTLWLMKTRGGFNPLVRVAPAVNIPLGMLMGLLWMGGLVLYGYASQMLGPLGLVLGWPIMMGCTVLTANAWGAATGEWKGAPRTALRWIAVGVSLLIAGIIVISSAGAL